MDEIEDMLVKKSAIHGGLENAIRELPAGEFSELLKAKYKAKVDRIVLPDPDSPSYRRGEWDSKELTVGLYDEKDEKVGELGLKYGRWIVTERGLTDFQAYGEGYRATRDVSYMEKEHVGWLVYRDLKARVKGNWREDCIGTYKKIAQIINNIGDWEVSTKLWEFPDRY
ncbi:MAG: hypothetical protein ABIB71_00560 [Candidatus Woesearchaeota archaeon]